SILGKFSDASLVSSYARGSLAFCYREGILDPGNGSISPKTPILREEIASMVYELLKRARLI
ncbi:MAG: S-layer homology domain-containing protein, partial [Firmicutes bacterium]|nr:S-layer homology domain-containing protein [Bacillota bacterium]